MTCCFNESSSITGLVDGNDFGSAGRPLWLGSSFINLQLPTGVPLGTQIFWIGSQVNFGFMQEVGVVQLLPAGNARLGRAVKAMPVDIRKLMPSADSMGELVNAFWLLSIEVFATLKF